MLRIEHNLLVLMPFLGQGLSTYIASPFGRKSRPSHFWMTSLALTALLVLGVVFASPVQAGLTVTPITWDVIGLDSNDETVGPNQFPVGVRICATNGTETNVNAVLKWDTATAYIDYQPNSLGTVANPIVLSSVDTSCSDAYFNVQVQRNDLARETSREYHVEVTSDQTATPVSTPRPRQLYVEYLISQNRNGVDAVSGFNFNGTDIPAGGSAGVVIGGTYTLTVTGYTATQGYEQFEDFVNLPNNIFEILSVSTKYAANTSPWIDGGAKPATHDQLYADACEWDPNPTSPNYLSCVGGDYKTGGNPVVTTYVLKIKQPPPGVTSVNLNALLYDFSGSSFHYNGDFGSGGRTVYFQNPTVTKAFQPSTIAEGGKSTMVISLVNPTATTIEGANITDLLPAGMSLHSPQRTSLTNCGDPESAHPPTLSFSTVSSRTQLTFINGSLTPNIPCVVEVDVTVAGSGNYENTTEHLFINGTTAGTGGDTGKFASATLVVEEVECTNSDKAARWSVPNTATSPPDTTGGVPAGTITSPIVSMNSLASVIADKVVDQDIKSGVTGPTGSDGFVWRTWGYKDAGQVITFSLNTASQGLTSLSLSYWYQSDLSGGSPTNYKVEISGNNGVNWTQVKDVVIPSSGWNQETINLSTVLLNGIVKVRITPYGASANTFNQWFYLEQMEFSGSSSSCPVPPVISKAFADDPIPVGDTTQLAFTITNTNASLLTGVAFEDLLPAGMVLNSSTISGPTCTPAQTLTGLVADTTDDSISLTDGTLNDSTSCTFSVDVKSDQANTYHNVTSAITANESEPGGYAEDSLTVLDPPLLEKKFAISPIPVGESTTLYFTVSNPNATTALTGVGFTDTLDASLTPTTGIIGKTCVPEADEQTVSPSISANAVTLATATLSAGGTCTFGVTVMAGTPGTVNNVTSPVSSTEAGNGDTATDSLVVTALNPSISLLKQVGGTATGPWYDFHTVFPPLPGDAYFRFVIENTGDANFTSIQLTDPNLGGISIANCKDYDGNGVLQVGNPILNESLSKYFTRICFSISSLAVTDPGAYDNVATVQGNSAAGNVTAQSTANFATAGLSLSKVADPQTFTAAGQTISYSYTVTNSGDAPLLGPVTVSDDKITIITCNPVKTVTHPSEYLALGESVTCTGTYVTTAEDVTAKSVTNTASAQMEGITSEEVSEEIILPSPALSLVKSEPAGSLTVGSTLTYTVTGTNTGNITQTNVVVSDPKLTEASTKTCATLAPEATCALTGTYVVLQTDVDAGQIVNTASVQSTQVTNPVTDTQTTTISRNPELSLAKSASPTTYNAVNAEITYSYEVTNDGNVTITNLAVTDNKIATVTCSTTTLAPGASTTCTATYTIKQADINAGSVTNIASATGKGPNNASVTSPEDTYTVNGPVAGPSLALSKSANPMSYGAVDDSITYTYVVTNNGNVTLQAPFAVTDNKIVAPNAVNCSAAPATLAPLASFTCTASYRITQADVVAGLVTNTASATGKNGSTTVTSPTDSETVTIAPAPALSLEKSATPSIYTAVDDVISYSYVVTNVGNVAITALAVSDDKIATVTCPTTSLALEASTTCTASYTITQADIEAGSVTNTAYATGQGPNSTATRSPSDTYTVTGPVARPSLAISKSASPMTYGTVGETITYSYAVSNNGNVTLKAPFAVTDDKIASNAVSCSSAPNELATGASFTCTASYLITQADLDDGSVTNKAVATGKNKNDDTTVTSLPDSETITVKSAPALSLVKSAPAGSPTLGATLTYTVTATNSGNTTQNNVVVSDPMLTNDSSWTCDTLAPNATCVLTGTYVVKQADVDAGEIVNTASVESAQVARKVTDTRVTPIEPPTPIPTLSEWATILLVLLVMGMAGWRIRELRGL